MGFEASKLGWYWHRLLAMNPREIGLRVRKKVYAKQDAGYVSPRDVVLKAAGKFPQLPRKEDAPGELLEGLRRDVADILGGRWKAFGHFPLQVDDPPKWQFDYFVQKDFTTSKSAFKIDHRHQPGGADIKIIWEPNRWYQLVRLAMAAWLLEDRAAGEKCIAWLKDWTAKNPPFTGLNWTSGLETGIRLVQFAWIDAFLGASGVGEETLDELRAEIIPPHVWYTSRHRSFGSSANNHLTGELAGLILAVARWPEAARWTDSLAELQREFEREVLLQFGADGGNLEQALGYHLFSWEFCWQSSVALKSAGKRISPEVEERLVRGGHFYAGVKPCADVWDYGDSDNAWVTPLFADETKCGAEWWKYFDELQTSPALRYFWGEFPKGEVANEGWKYFAETGYATFRKGEWFLRWDLSPLGYPKMAPHGHLDALHVSIWHRGEPLVIDPGTGTYYAEKEIRTHLAEWAAHNGPYVRGTGFPKRRGMFLWGQQHAIPRFAVIEHDEARAEFVHPAGRINRKITFLGEGFRIEDVVRGGGSGVVVGHWKFGPKASLGEGGGTLQISGAKYGIELESWKIASRFDPPMEQRARAVYRASDLPKVPLKGIVSPAFRALTVGPFLELEAPKDTHLSFTLHAGK